MIKLRNILPFLLMAGGLHAQVETPKVDQEVSPPKAMVIEEEADITVDDAKVIPAGKRAEETPNEVGKSPEKPAMAGKAAGNADNADSANNTKDKPNPKLVKPAAEMPPLSELRPLIPAPKKTVNEGIQIQVEKVKGATSHAGGTGKGKGNGKVNVSSPWPAKPLDSPPLGWKYIPAPGGIDPYRTTVKLGDEKSVNLSITPYVLVPASDGRNVIRIAEPGYQPAEGYLQENTIGSILKKSTEELEHHEKRASAAILRLQQLLSSLPQS